MTSQPGAEEAEPRESPGAGPDHEEPRRRLRLAGGVTLLVLGGVLLFLANVLLWIDTTILDSNEFSDSIRRTLEQPEVEQRIGDVIAAEAIQSADLQSRIETELPAEFSFVVPILGSQLEPLLSEVVSRLLGTSAVQSLTQEAALRFHQRVIAILRDERTLVEVQRNEGLVLDLGELSNRLFSEIGVTPPAEVQDLQERGRIVILEDTSGLDEVSFFVKNSGTLTLVSLLGAIACFGVVVFVWPRRRAGVLAVGAAVLLVGVLTLLAVAISNLALESAAGERIVARELVRQLERNLRWQSLALVVLGACLVVVADRRILAPLEGWEEKARVQIERLGAVRTLLLLGGAGALGIFLLA